MPIPLRPDDPPVLGGFRLLGRLGEGGQGVVYLGESPERERVAVKLLHLGGDAQARRRFAKELAAARRVDPFCTARILTADVQGSVPYIVSEFIDGPSLREVVRERGPRHGSALDRLAIGTATALTAIHQAGVVHRDFKPANVILGPDGPRVIDFGVAQAVDATLTGGVTGTPAYMAPEQLRNEPPGPAADVFAWGATMVYAATGRPPFGRDAVGAVINRIVTEPPDLGALAGPLRELVVSCLDKDAERRPSARQVLLRLLGHDDVTEPLREGAGLAAAPSAYGPAPAATRIGHGPSRVRRALTAVGVFAAAAALGAAVVVVALNASGGSERGDGGRSATPPAPAGVTWFQGHLGLVLKPTWRAVPTDSGTHVLTERSCAAPELGFFRSQCAGFWIMGPTQIGTGAHGFGSYQPGTMYYPASDVEPCPPQPPYMIHAPTSPRVSEARRVGDRTSAYTEWGVDCRDESSTKILSGFTQREWYLAAEQVLIVDQFSVPELPQLLSSAVWR